MSRRSGRAKPQKTAASLPDSVKRGLSSLISGNEAVVAGMLDAARDSDLLAALIDVLAVNSLSPEGLLAQWFSAPMLSSYAASIGKSPKGNEITLAARIASAWAKPSFQPPAELAANDSPGASNAGTAGLLEKMQALDDNTGSEDDGDVQAPPRKRAKKLNVECGEVATGGAGAAGLDNHKRDRKIRGVTNIRYVEGRLQCKVRWEGCDKSEDSWVDRESVTSDQVAKYEKRRLRKQQQKVEQK